MNEDQRQVQDLLRRVARERVAPRAAEIDRTAEYPQDMFDLLKSLGIFALPFPTQYGGADSTLSACVAVEELGRVCYNTAYLLVVQWTAVGAVLAGGTDAQKQRLLPDLATGARRASISVTETQSGSDVRGIRTRAHRVPGGYRITGSKVWCTGASISDYILVAARTGDDDTPAGINFFVVERGAKGLQIGRKEEKTGARGIPSCPLFLDEVFVASDDCLGLEEGGFKRVMEAFNTARPIHAARGVGLAQGAMDHAIEFTRNRHAFGHSVDSFQGVRWMLADMAIQIEAARSLVHRVAQMIDDGLSGKALAPMAAKAKAFATDTAMKVSIDAVQLFGASGITNDFPINRYMRDAKVLQIIEGTNQIQRNIVASALLGPEGAGRPERPR